MGEAGIPVRTTGTTGTIYPVAQNNILEAIRKVHLAVPVPPPTKKILICPNFRILKKVITFIQLP